MINGKVIILFVTAAMLLMGLIFGGASIVMGISEKNRKAACTQKTWGTVTNMEREKLAGSVGEAYTYSWYPTFTYEANGQTISKRSSYGSAKENFYINQQVTVFYNPKNPNEFYVLEEKASGVRTIFLITSAGLILAGVIALACYICFFRN